MEKWDKIEKIIFTGDRETVNNLKCPECGHKLEIEFTKETMSLSITCPGCRRMSRATGCFYVPRYLENQ